MQRPLAILAALLAAGCAASDPVKEQDLERIEKGMSQEEVRAILGNPSFASTDIGDVTRWVYERTERTYAPLRETTKASVVVTFAAGKVIAVERKNPGP